MIIREKKLRVMCAWNWEPLLLNVDRFRLCVRMPICLYVMCTDFYALHKRDNVDEEKEKRKN